MAVELDALCIDAGDPARLEQFWAGVLGSEGAIPFRFAATGEPKTVPNRMHFHLTSDSPEQQQETVTRVLELGGRHLDVGQLPEEEHVVLADPEGNELCVIEAGNNFLAGTGFLGELTCDGTREVGHFWSAALGWQLVWDQDEETAIQSPGGGTKISWGGPPVAPKVGRNRLHLDLVPAAGSDQDAEVDRLLSLGATRIDAFHDLAGSVALADPDGNEFCLLTGSN